MAAACCAAPMRSCARCAGHGHHSHCLGTRVVSRQGGSDRIKAKVCFHGARRKPDGRAVAGADVAARIRTTRRAAPMHGAGGDFRRVRGAATPVPAALPEQAEPARSFSRSRPDRGFSRRCRCRVHRCGAVGWRARWPAASGLTCCSDHARRAEFCAEALDGQAPLCRDAGRMAALTRRGRRPAGSGRADVGNCVATADA